MSQLFTLQFPKYHFDTQREFTITFNNATQLPFTYEITNNMVCVDHLLDPSDTQSTDPEYIKQQNSWRRMGLQRGVRIIKINTTDTTNEKNDNNHEDTKTDPNETIIKRDYIDNLISQNKNNPIDITFREDLLEYDDSISLGLTYDEKYHVDTKDDCDTPLTRPQSKLDQILGGVIKYVHPNQIGASSYEDGYEPKECRLNNPHSCWKARKKYIKLNGSWITVDFENKKMITKLRIQGEPKSKNNNDNDNNNNRGYVTSIWIDYSANGTTWICHNNTDGEYKLEYSQLDNNIFGAMDNTNSHDKYAEIEIWPPIHARFIRIRPTKYCISIAMRFDFYGPSTNRLEYARVIKYGDLSEEDRHSANLKLKHATMNTRLIQVDCKAVIRKALNDAGMSYVGFVETDKNNYLCVFSTADLTATERTIEELMDIGIGTAMGVAGICPMQFRRPTKQEWKDKQWEAEENKKFQEKHHVTAGFYASIKSRQIVDQMVDSTTQSAEFTYDYMSMLIVADVIAAMGLGTDSSVIVVASMLVSPIMGPVLALTFGVHLCKFKFAKALALLGLKNEIWSLIICILVGFIVGFIFIAITENDVNGEWPWPTTEMVSRGQWVGLVTGAVVAFASGVGVALSVVGDYTATVIGVAISASLLPPAVNCGMLWAMSVYVYIWPGRGCNVDECYDPNELAVMGTVSIILTIENIILVFLASWMMFCIKDVTLGARAKMMEDGNRQLVYQSITSFKDRYDDVKMRSSSYNLSRQKRPSLKHLSVAGETKNYLGKRLDDLTVDHTQKNKTLKKSIMRANTLVAHKGGYGYEGINRTQTELDGIILEDEEYTDFDEEYEFPGGKSKISLRLSNTDNSSRIQKIHTDSTNTLGVLQENESEPLVQNNSNTNPNIGQVIEMTDDDQHK